MRFSVIIPVYNSSATISGCVNSILDGDYTDFEIMLVDDGSSDRSLEVCSELAKKDDRIKVLHQSNKGAAAARNLGIRNSSGDYLCFVDSDDTVSKDYLSCIDRYCEKFTPDMVWFNMRCINENGTELFVSEHIVDRAQLSQTEYLSCFFGMNINIGSMCSKTYRRRFVLDNLDVLLAEGRIYGEDWDFNLRCGFYNPKIVLAKDVLYNYVKYSTQATVSTSYYRQDLDTYCHSYLQLLSIADKFKINASAKEQNSLFVYNVISLLGKLYRSSLTQAEKKEEFKRITMNDTFRSTVCEREWERRYMSLRQYAIGLALKLRCYKLAKLLLKL